MKGLSVTELKDILAAKMLEKRWGVNHVAAALEDRGVRCNPYTVRLWLKGRTRPSWDTAPKLADALGVSLEVLFGMGNGKELDRPSSFAQGFGPAGEHGQTQANTDKHRRTRTHTEKGLPWEDGLVPGLPVKRRALALKRRKQRRGIDSDSDSDSDSEKRVVANG